MALISKDLMSLGEFHATESESGMPEQHGHVQVTKRHNTACHWSSHLDTDVDHQSLDLRGSISFFLCSFDLLFKFETKI